MVVTCPVSQLDKDEWWERKSVIRISFGLIAKEAKEISSQSSVSELLWFFSTSISLTPWSPSFCPRFSTQASMGQVQWLFWLLRVGKDLWLKKNELCWKNRVWFVGSSVDFRFFKQTTTWWSPADILCPLLLQNDERDLPSQPQRQGVPHTQTSTHWEVTRLTWAKIGKDLFFRNLVLCRSDWRFPTNRGQVPRYMQRLWSSYLSLFHIGSRWLCEKNKILRNHEITVLSFSNIYIYFGGGEKKTSITLSSIAAAPSYRCTRLPSLPM